MKKILVAVLLLLAGPAFGAAISYQQATSLSTSTAIFLPNIPTNAPVGSALLTVEGAGIRWRDDGVAPTSSIGQPVSAGQALCYGGPPGAMQVIGQTAGATIDVTYYTSDGCASR